MFSDTNHIAISHHFQSCTYKTSQKGEWLHGIAKVKSHDYSDVGAICDLDLKLVKDVFDYRLTTPMAATPVGFTITQYIAKPEPMIVTHDISDDPNYRAGYGDAFYERGFSDKVGYDYHKYTIGFDAGTIFLIKYRADKLASKR
jgi:hypothetical protein